MVAGVVGVTSRHDLYWEWSLRELLKMAEGACLQSSRAMSLLANIHSQKTKFNPEVFNPFAEETKRRRTSSSGIPLTKSSLHAMKPLFMKVSERMKQDGPKS